MNSPAVYVGLLPGLTWSPKIGGIAMRGILIGPSSLLLALAFTPAAAQDPLTRVSLDDALQLALRQSPTVRAKEAEVQSSKAAQTTAFPGVRTRVDTTVAIELAAS